MAFDPQGDTLASGSVDRRVRLWNVASGRLLRTLDGHMGPVYGVAFNPRGETLASASADQKIRLWDMATGQLLSTLEMHSPMRPPPVRLPRLIVPQQDLAASTLAFDPQGRKIASVSDDLSVRLWDLDSGRLTGLINIEFLPITSVAFHPNGETLAIATIDGTVNLMNVAKGMLFRKLEGNTGIVESITFSPDGLLLASKSNGDTIRVWSCTTWKTVAVMLTGHSGSYSWIPALAFHPDEHRERPLLAAAGSAPGTPEAERGREIHLYELDLNVLLGRPTSSVVNYTSAKVVLVGESNVGKSYLAHRIATGLPPTNAEIRSTHGMKFWPLEPNRPDLHESEKNIASMLPATHTDKLFGSQQEGDPLHRRDIVLWDMGGQEEYRLIHQLFLHDTTVALVLLDPTRGATALKEVETWNKALEKQLRGRQTVKILVGSKLDEESQMIDRDAIERLRSTCGFTAYIETIALTGRGVEDLCVEIGKAIDWKNLSETSRPELFQAIRDQIEARRKRGQVVVLFDEFEHDLSTNEELETFSLLDHEVALTSDAEARTRALETVCSQLAQQGVIARATTSDGKASLILRIEEIERYAGSLILAARANRRDRGVPALELRTIAQEQFAFPEIAPSDRLPRANETAVVECTVQLLLQHGICFQHEGLLVFPSLFDASPDATAEKLPHSVSLYYDFAGAIDNIYASLVAWLVLAKEFGKVRLWADRAEFEVDDAGLCGLRKVTRPGGFAHVDVYFDDQTPSRKQQEFISFVEDHLARHGIEIREHVAIKCPCGEEFSEETVRKRITRGDSDIVCQVCEARHSLVEGATAVREKNPEIAQHTWALRTQIENAREQVAREAIQAIGRAETLKPVGPIRILHLSDLHFTKETPVSARLQWLLDDLKGPPKDGLGIQTLDYLVISGDFTDRANEAGFEKAYDFVSGLTREFGLSAERCLFVPGNHDVVDRLDAYKRHKDATGLKDGEWHQQGMLVMGRDPEKYPLRFEPFSKSFYHKFLQRPYPLEYAQQGMSLPFWDTGIQFLLFNSCWQIDEFNRKRSGLHVESVAHAIRQAQQQETEAREGRQLAADQPLLRLAVWHHAVTGANQMQDTVFLENLQKNGVRLALHGDIHEYERNQVGYRHDKGIHVVGSGSFGARANDRPESTPRLYNVFEIARDLKSARIHTRSQPKLDGPWGGWHEWPNPDGVGRVAYYDINL